MAAQTTKGCEGPRAHGCGLAEAGVLPAGAVSVSGEASAGLQGGSAAAGVAWGGPRADKGTEGCRHRACGRDKGEEEAQVKLWPRLPRGGSRGANKNARRRTAPA